MAAFLVVASCFTLAGRAQDEDSSDGSTALSGLLATFRRAPGDAVLDQRIERFAALHVAVGEAPSAFLEPGPFHVTMSGLLNLRLRSRLSFRAQGRGTLRLRVGEDVLLDVSGEDLSVQSTAEDRYSKGETPLTVEYSSPTEGDAWFRLEWSGSRFDWEPMPRSALHLDPGAQSAATASFDELRLGRERFAQLRCVRCHATPSEREALLEHGMRELALDAPDLSDVGSRLQPNWLASWLLDPREWRANATMPRLFAQRSLEETAAAGDPAVSDLVAWLSRQRSDDPGSDAVESDAASPANAESARNLAERGGVFFAELGCIACHLLPAAGKLDASGAERIGLWHVARKWTERGLQRFLQNPHRTYQWVRMPDFGLSADEAAALARFLMARSADTGPTLPEVPAGDVERGEAVFRTLGCAQCHGLAASTVAPQHTTGSFATDLFTKTAPPIGSNGCLGQAGGTPRFDLSDTDRSALLAFAARAFDSLERHSSAEFATRQVRALQCNACHTIDEAHDRWAELAVETLNLLDEASSPTLDQSRPSLTWVGEKLQSTAIRALLDGTLEHRARPWLRARMPSFPARAETLALGLAAQHGMAWSEPEPAQAAADTCRIAADLLSAKGFACDACHGIGSTVPGSSFEFGTPNLALAHSRIRPNYFDRWMLNPLRVEPGSKMPRFAADDGTSPLPEYYDGDIHRQFEAIRAYLSTLDPDSVPNR